MAVAVHTTGTAHGQWSGHGVAAEGPAPVGVPSDQLFPCCRYLSMPRTKAALTSHSSNLHRRLGTWTASLLIWVPQLPQSAQATRSLHLLRPLLSFIYSLPKRLYTRLSNITSCSLLLAPTARLIKSHPLPTPHLINRNGSPISQLPARRQTPSEPKPACRELSLAEHLSVNSTSLGELIYMGNPADC